jgi:hypothetical protein
MLLTLLFNCAGIVVSLRSCQALLGNATIAKKSVRLPLLMSGVHCVNYKRVSTEA